MIILLLISICLIPLIFTKNVFYDKKHGLKHTFTNSGIISEWDFNNSLTHLKLLSIFIQGEDDAESRKKYIKQYNRFKKSLEKAGYNVSDFPEYVN